MNNTKQVGKYTVEVLRIQGAAIKEFVKQYSKENIVKFIFYKGTLCEDLSFVEVNDIHKVKHLFSAKKYTRLPLKLIQTEEDKYVRGIEITQDENDCDGFVLVAKTDVWDSFNKVRYNAKERNAKAEELCVEELKVMNNILKANAFQIGYKEDETYKGFTFLVCDGQETDESVLDSLGDLSEDIIDSIVKVENQIK